MRVGVLRVGVLRVGVLRVGVLRFTFQGYACDGRVVSVFLWVGRFLLCCLESGQVVLRTPA